MKLMSNIIEDIKNLRTNRAGERHGYFTIDGEPKEDAFILDTVKICEALSRYEIDYELADEMPEHEKNPYSFYENDFAEDYIEYLDELGYIDSDEGKGNNTYNWSSPVSNNINYEEIKSLIDDSVYVLFRVHRWGDVRGNYTEHCILHFDHDYEWFEAFDEVNRTEYIEIDGVNYAVEINFWRDGFEVYTEGDWDYLFDVYGSDREEIIEAIKNKLAEKED
jgi:hypothetical protein